SGSRFKARFDLILSVMLSYTDPSFDSPISVKMIPATEPDLNQPRTSMPLLLNVRHESIFARTLLPISPSGTISRDRSINMKGLFDLSDLLRSSARILLKTSSLYSSEGKASTSAPYSEPIFSRAGGKSRVADDNVFFMIVFALRLMKCSKSSFSLLKWNRKNHSLTEGFLRPIVDF